MAYLPYKGSGRAIIDVAGGQINMMVENEPAELAHIKSRRLRATSVTGAARSMQLTDVPTMVKLGYPDFVVEVWFGFRAPARTPPAAIEKLNGAFNTSPQNPRTSRRLEEVSVNISGGTPEVFAAHMKREFEKWAAVIKANNVVAE